MLRFLFLLISISFSVFVLQQGGYSYPKKDNPGCNNECHGSGHVYKEGMIRVVKPDDSTFNIYVRNLDKNKRYVIGAELVDSSGKILSWINHTLKQPIVLTAPEPGKYLLYVAGSYNGMNMRYDSAYAETGMDFGLLITGKSTDEICAGDSLYIDYKAAGDFGPNVTFIAVLSNELGEFTEQTIIGTVSGPMEGTIPCLIPEEVPGSENYKIRISIKGADLTSKVDSIVIRPFPNTQINGETLINKNQNYDYSVVSGNRDTFKWYVKGGKIIYRNKDNNLITVSWQTPGDGSVCVTEENAYGCYDSTCLEINIITGVDEYDINHTILIYPNPATGEFTVGSLAEKDNIIKISIYNNIGILEKNITFQRLYQTVTFRDPGLKSGLYFIKIETISGVATKKLFIL